VRAVNGDDNRTGRPDPIRCDACNRVVDFDPMLAKAARDYGGVVICDACNPRFNHSSFDGRVHSDGSIEHLPDSKDPPKA
jgi:hypothetical protein